MSPVGRLLLRNVRLFEGAGSVLWLNPPADCPWREISAASDRLQLFCQDYGDWRLLSEAGADARFGVLPQPQEAPAYLVLTLPREKSRLRMLAHFAASLLTPAGHMLVAGENRAGIKSSPGHLRPWFEAVEHIDSARHCVLFQAERPLLPAPFLLDDYREKWTLDASDGRLNIHSWPGVFAHGSLDAGSRLLLAHLPKITPGSAVLDFGCGAGVLGAAILQREPSVRCTLTDASALACKSAESTLEANALRGQVVPSDGFSNIQERFDLIISNPPFHQGHRASPRLSPALLAPIRNFLNRGGQFLMVANRHLPYRSWLDEVFGTHELIAGNRGYHVLAASEPAGGAPGPGSAERSRC